MLANSLIVRSEVWKTDESNPKIPQSSARRCSLSMPYCPKEVGQRSLPLAGKGKVALMRALSGLRGSMPRIWIGLFWEGG